MYNLGGSISTTHQGNSREKRVKLKSEECSICGKKCVLVKMNTKRIRYNELPGLAKAIASFDEKKYQEELKKHEGLFVLVP
ncbi:hypothetical protein BB559_000094 [Furculomyces boomerangus]|uniref:Uncharacterized protein n=2 Tax=Harpellales TaxID=61421 RepID=A0A2T9Z685_9FUNG|nr:hypothetical protein BB559_000094 [Furculomyces boomerangus]PWA00577.1 hypothetical protein BB558_003387 [Smittium angustum]